MVKNLIELKFKGSFRSYQQKILNNADKFLDDGKINIVAAPGSGKTILGLELVRRLNQNTLILSPTTTIRNQWGDRFSDWFLETEKQEGYISYSLKEIKSINSITYQALHAAMIHITYEEDGEINDYTNVDLFQIIKNYDIKTICLDEAHHLKNEWQKSLEKFLSIISDTVKIISLTATPPYDSSASEWNRYINVSGEIDDEIFVPELVKDKVLAPHQDYIYFNYPTKEEVKILNDYKKQVVLAVEQISKLNSFEFFAKRLCEKKFVEEDYLLKNVSEFVSLYVLIKNCGYPYNKHHIRIIAGRNNLPRFNLTRAEEAIQFMLSTELTTVEFKKELNVILREHGLINRKRVNFTESDQLKRTLMASLGKLKSIKDISQSEYKSLGSDLRQLILTDYIDRESINLINTNFAFKSISVISIFEEMRRSNITNNIAILSGTLVIVNENILKELDLLASNQNVKYTQKKVNNTNFYHIIFNSNNKLKVQIIGELFEKGLINILIGTKALLGEGWDSPTINTLIMASFVGSFVSSNQMRGRAIRVDKNNLNKSANIWHLVTIEPDYIFEKNSLNKNLMKLIKNDETFISNDFNTLTRRFNAFVGPNYREDVIENGIDRITIIEPPYNVEKFNQINKTMIENSNKRNELMIKWENSLEKSTELHVLSRVEKTKAVRPFTFVNISTIILFSVIESVFLQTLVRSAQYDFELPILITIWIAFGIVGYFFIKFLRRLIILFSPRKTIFKLSNAILLTLKNMDVIKSNSSIDIKTDETGQILTIVLLNASLNEQNIFNKAISELLSPIDNPRYIIIKKTFNAYEYKTSYSCPEIIGKDEKYANTLKKYLTSTIGKLEMIYTRYEKGRKILLRSRKRSSVNRNAKYTGQYKKSNRWN
ncbi:MAG: DEAD/DEAH box helicase family protein [Bacilli bacterium]|nr:DEAD/DEAH box helicase family protein [Bacilli bacterium]